MEEQFEFVMNGRLSNTSPRIIVYSAKKNKDGGYWIEWHNFGDWGSMPFADEEVKRNLEIGAWIKLEEFSLLKR